MTAAFGALAAVVLLVPVAQGLPGGVPDETWGVNGRVNAIVQAGNVVFLGGSFSEAREDGGAGPGVLPRNNIAALDATTGAPIDGWDPNLDGEVYALAASSDGTTIYAGGTFTTADGLPRSRLVALDAATGAVSGTWRPKAPNASVRTLALAGNRIYAGGGFTSVGLETRHRLAAFDSATGALDASWRPTADGLVRTLAISADGKRVFAGGEFAAISGQIRKNAVALGATSGAVDADWHPDPGNNVFGLVAEDGTVYAAVGGTANSLHAWDASTGAERWRKSSDGDFQALAVGGGIVYAGGHFNNFEGELRRKLVAVDADTGALRRDWYPKLPHSAATWDGIWAVSTYGDSRLAVGGAFDSISGFEQEHFAQFTGSLGGASQDTTPPTTPTGLTATAIGGGRVELSWSASADDDGVAEYRILRDGVQVATSGVSRYSDTGVEPNTSYSYRVLAADFAGNASPSSASATAATSPPDEIRTFAATEDSYVDATAPDANFGSAGTLPVDAKPKRDLLLKFKLAGIGDRRILAAKLRLHATDASNDGGYFRRVANNSWSEDTVTWRSAPAGDSALLGVLGDVESDSWTELDVTPLVGGDGTVSLRGNSFSVDEAVYSSTEGSAAEAPQLVVTLADEDAEVPPTPVFSDGFESGDLSGWSADSGLAVRGDDHFSGAWAARATSTGQPAYAFKSLRVSEQELYSQLRFKVMSQGGSSVSLLKIQTGTGSGIMRLYLLSSGKLATRNDVAGTSTTSSTGLTPDRWHTAQIRVLVDNAQSEVEVWLDGVKVGALSKTESLGTTPIGRIEVGDDATGKSYDVLFDEAVADTRAIADKTPPTAPTGLSAVVSSTTAVELTWGAASDDLGVTGYEIYRDGALLTTVGQATAYTDTPVSEGTSYEYEIRARDAAGNTSRASEPARVTTPGDTTPPSVPTLTATAVSFDRVDLSWAGSTDNVAVTEYRIYRDGEPLETVPAGTRTLRDTSVASSTGYDYVVTAVDGAGNVSGPSPSARATTPARTVFLDGFESGDLSQWTGGVGLVVERGSAFAGEFAARGTTTGSPAYKYRQLSPGNDELTYELRFKIVSRTGSFSLLKLRTASGSALTRLWLTSSGDLSVRNDLTGVSTTSSTRIETGRWYTAKLRAVADGATSRVDVWLDGVKIDALSKSESLGTTPIGRIQLGDDTSGKTFDVLYDDVTVDAPPVNTAPPTISGTARDGETLSADRGSWSGTEPISYAYRWRRCDGGGAGCADIPGAGGQSYTLTGADVGSTIRVEVIGSNSAGSVDAVSEPSAPVAAIPPANTGLPTISGTAKDGQILTVDPGTWSGTEPLDYAYQWQRCGLASCADILGATQQTLQLTAADVGFSLRVRVTASNVADQSSEYSAATGPVAPLPLDDLKSYDINSGSPSFSSRTVTLEDRFVHSSVKVAAPLELLTAANRDGAGINRRDHRLKCYSIDAPSFTDRTVKVQSQFGTQSLRAEDAKELCAPASKGAPSTDPGAPPPGLDNYKCYELGSSSSLDRSVSLEDEFVRDQVKVKSARFLCTPVSINSEGIQRPADQLVCYELGDLNSFTKRKLSLRDRFGLQTSEVERPRKLCVPATIL